MLPSTTVVIGSNNSSKIRYKFCNKPFKAFLKCQMSKDKSTPLLAIKNLLFWWDRPSSFLHVVIFFCKVLILYKSIVHKGGSSPSFFKALTPWPSLPPFLTSLFPLLSFLVLPLLRYFRQFPLPSRNPLLP